MTKYQKYFQCMIEENQELFDEFKRAHDAYEKNPSEAKKQFNAVGEKVSDVLRRYEKLLCQKSERSQYGKFSSNLADRFRDEVRKHFPKIDFIGIE